MNTPTDAEGPQVTFFVESREESDAAKRTGETESRGEFLSNRLGGGDVITALQSVRGRIAIALSRREISQDRALVDFLREYDILGLDVDIWPTLSDEQGYWLHAGNMESAYGEVIEIINALERAHVRFANVGLDLEFPMGIMRGGFNIREYFRTKPWRYSPSMAHVYLQNLIEEILRESKHGVHSYEIPILGDHDALRKLLGIPPPVQTSEIQSEKYKRVGLVYTSAKPPLVGGKAEDFVQKYSAGRGRMPALGIVSANETNPGRTIGKPPHLLTDQELKRDVGAALKVSPQEFFVFALNGLSVIERTRTAIAANLQA